MARLAAAVNRAPARPAPAGPATATAAAARPAAPAQPRPATAEKPRFGINSLINRMTGHAAEGQPPERAPAPARAQPPVTAYDDEQDADPEQDRIEIPAFLRRQAN
jgi:cell division protein FtsZ